MRYKKFTTGLMQWHLQVNKRHMPWKGEKDPYKVWLSEIILQQTRVDQGRAYYEKFVQQFPTIQHLAKAKDEAVFKLWEGLGYYTRCKNLLATARLITKTYKGVFPGTYESIVSLKGVGPYTAAAIASFCFNLPHAVLDGNVFRVLSRYCGIDTPVDSSTGKKIFGDLAAKMLDTKQPGLYNQAIMDFGATVCKPQLPLCSLCPLQASCVAHKKGMVNRLPVKEKTLKKKQRWFSYFIFKAGDTILVHKRTAKDIWQNLYEFYPVETDGNPHWDKAAVTAMLAVNIGLDKFEVLQIQPAAAQQLTHQLIKGYFINIALPSIPAALKSGEYEWVQEHLAGKYAFPVFINQHLRNKNQQGMLF